MTRETKPTMTTGQALTKTPDVVTKVAERVRALVENDELHLPKNYSAENAMKAAWLALQQAVDKSGRRALDVCRPESIANALLDMIIQGLNPAKDQCYFITYGDRLVCMRSYFGTVGLLRRAYGDEARVVAEVVYEGDIFEYALVNGRKRIVKHEQKLANIDTSKLVAAYAVVYLVDGDEPDHVEVMTMDQIRRAWQQGATSGKSPAHTGFPEEMARKTVINRACKVLINASGDDYLLRAMERQTVAVAYAESEASADAAIESAPLVDFDALPPQVESDVQADDEDASESADTDQAAPEMIDDQASPSKLFGELIEERRLNPTAARRAAADMVGLTDVRLLSNNHFKIILSKEEEFLRHYADMAPQPKLGEID